MQNFLSVTFHNNGVLPPHTPSLATPSITLPEDFDHPWDVSLPDPPPHVSFDFPHTIHPHASPPIAPTAPIPPPILDPPVIHLRMPPAPLANTRSGRSVRPLPRFDETSHSYIHAYSATYSPD